MNIYKALVSTEGGNQSHLKVVRIRPLPGS